MLNHPVLVEEVGDLIPGENATFDIIYQTGNDAPLISFFNASISASSGGQSRPISSLTAAPGAEPTFQLFSSNPSNAQGSQFINVSGDVPFFRIVVPTQPTDTALQINVNPLNALIEPGVAVALPTGFSGTFPLSATTGTINGSVFVDTNHNGTAEFIETFPGTVVMLQGTAGDAIGVSTTDMADLSGFFEFDNLPAGTYDVSISPPLTGNAVLDQRILASTISIPLSMQVTLAAGETKTASFLGLAAADANEPNDSVLVATPLTGGTQVIPNQTLLNGDSDNFALNLGAGRFRVEIDWQTFDAQGNPLSPTPNLGVNVGGIVDNYSDGDLFIDLPDVTGTVPLSISQTGGPPLDDFFYEVAVTTTDITPGSISGSVFFDRNRNGILDATGEGPMEGLRVGAFPTGTVISGSTVPVGAGFVGLDGTFSIRDLPPGTYDVAVISTDPNGIVDSTYSGLFREDAVRYQAITPAGGVSPGIVVAPGMEVGGLLFGANVGPDDPDRSSGDNDIASANDQGIAAQGLITDRTILPNDVDFYRFEPDTTGLFTATVTPFDIDRTGSVDPLVEGITVDLFDANGDLITTGQIDEDPTTGVTDASLSITPDFGTYYVRVGSLPGINAAYQLQFNVQTNTGTISGRKILDSDRNGQVATGTDVTTQWITQPDPLNPPQLTPGAWGDLGPESFGTYDPATSLWRLDTTGDFLPDTSFTYGSAGNMSAPGRFNGGARDVVAVYDSSTGNWLIDSNDNRLPDDTPVPFGVPNGLPIVGDWNGDGTDAIGVFVPGDATTPGMFMLDLNGDGVNNDTPRTGSICSNGCTPLVGDFNGDGFVDVGDYDALTGFGRLDTEGDGLGGPDDIQFDFSGEEGFGAGLVVTFDTWDNGSSEETPAIYVRGNGRKTVDTNRNFALDEAPGQFPPGGDALFGLKQPSSKATGGLFDYDTGQLFVDLDGDGSFSMLPELGVQGIVIELFDASDPITPIASTTTGPDGFYVFSGLADGQYIVRENLTASGEVGARFANQAASGRTVQITNGATMPDIDLLNTLATDAFDAAAPNDTPQTATMLNDGFTPFAAIDFASIGPFGFDADDFWNFTSPTKFLQYEFNVIDINNDGTVNEQEQNVKIQVETTDDPGNVLSEDDGSDGQVAGVVVTDENGKTHQFNVEQADQLSPGLSSALRGFIRANDEADGATGGGNDDMATATDINDANGLIGTITPALGSDPADQDWFKFVTPGSVGSITITPRNGEPFDIQFFDNSAATITLNLVTDPVTGEVTVTGFDQFTGPIFGRVAGTDAQAAFAYDLNARIDTGSISGFIIEDRDGDGSTPGDMGAGLGVVVRLFADNGDRIFDPNADALVRSMIANMVNGHFDFTALPEGDYFVDLDPASLAIDKQQTDGGDSFPNMPFYSVTLDEQNPSVSFRDFAVAQLATFSGTVIDEQGTPLPGVIVEFRRAGQLVSTTVTNAGGGFVSNNLLPGPYSITYALEGFNTVIQPRSLTGGVMQKLGEIPMTLGTVTEELIVTAESPLLDPENAFTGFGDSSPDQVTTQTENDNDFARLEERSDAGINADLSLPDSVTDLFFEFRFPQAGVGDELQVNVIVDGNSQTIATFVATDFPGTDFQFSGPISLRDFAGQDVTLELRLTTVDPVDSIVELDNIVIKALAFDTVLANEKGVVEYTDAEGNEVAVTLKGAGALQVLRPGGTGDDLTTPADALGYIVTGSGAKSSLSVKVKADKNVVTSTGVTRVTDINIDGPISKIDGKAVDLLGDMTTGPVKAVVLHDVKGDHNITIDNTGAGAKDSVTLSFNEIEDLVLTSLLPIKSLTAVSWTDTNGATVPDKVETSSLGKLSIKGNKKTNNVGAFEADIIVTGDPNAKTAFGGASIAGPATGVSILVTGDAGALAFKDAVSSALVTITGASKGFSAAGDLTNVTLNLAQGTSKIAGKKATNVNLTGSDYGSLAFNTIDGGNFTVDSIKSLVAKADKKTGDVGAINNLIVDLAGSNNPKVKDTLGSLKADGGSTNLDVELFGSGGSVDIKGAIDQLLYAASGNIKSIKLGDVNNATLDGDSVGSVQAVRWLTGQAIFTDLKSLKTTGDKKTNTPGDLGASIGINPDGVSTAKVEFGGAKIAGTLTGLWNVFGSTGAIAADAIDAGFDAVIEFDVKSLASKAMFDGFIAARSFGKIDVKTTMTAATIIAFSIPGENSSIGSLKTGGDVTGGTRIYVGVDPVDDTIDDDNDVLKGGPDNFIKSLTIGGDAAADTEIAAGAFPKTVSINKTKIDPLTDDRFILS